MEHVVGQAHPQPVLLKLAMDSEHHCENTTCVPLLGRQLPQSDAVVSLKRMVGQMSYCHELVKEFDCWLYHNYHDHRYILLMNYYTNKP